MRVADYAAAFVADLGVGEVFSVVGAGAMVLNDAFGARDDLNYICTQHEQGAAMAAEGHARIRGDLGVILVTTGPGGINSMTGVCGAWIDSIPMLVISGQVTRNNMIADSGLRQFGVQEADVMAMARTVTKYAVCVTDAQEIRYHLEKAVHLARTGRPGPVWLEIPIDVQGAIIDSGTLRGFTAPVEDSGEPDLESLAAEALSLITAAERPVLYPGNGIHLAGAEDDFRRLVEATGFPVVSSWNATDLLPADHGAFIGHCGILGDRAGNFTVQNSDLLIVIGSRMSVPQTGYNFELFARDAKIVMVDVDGTEMRKPSFNVDLPVVADAGDFIRALLAKLDGGKRPGWLATCSDWKARYPVVTDEQRNIPDKVNSFHFIDELSGRLPSGAIVTTDMGTAFTGTMQSFKAKQGQRLFTSSGLAAMGFGLPGAIGACFANNKQRVYLIAGDGGLQMSVMELQTVAHHNLPITIFLLENNGYLSIRMTQMGHYGHLVGADPDSGYSCPDFVKVAGAYGIAAMRIGNAGELGAGLDKALAASGPLLCEISMPADQSLGARVTTRKMEDGSLIAKPLEDMYPFLDRDEFRANMIVKPVQDD